MNIKDAVIKMQTEIRKEGHSDWGNLLDTVLAILDEKELESQLAAAREGLEKIANNPIMTASSIMARETLARIKD